MDKDRCMLTVNGHHDGEGDQCPRPAAYVIVGPVYAPAQWLLDQGVDPDSPVDNQGFVAETHSCVQHLTEARDWFHDPDVHTVAEAVELERFGGSLSAIYGCRVVPIRAVPAA